LQDWVLKLRFATYEELEGVQGDVNWTLENKAAVIRILRKEDWGRFSEWSQDMEHTLVHELIHLHMALAFYGLKNSTEIPPDMAELLEEQATESIASGVVALMRLARSKDAKRSQTSPKSKAAKRPKDKAPELGELHPGDGQA
jgi:hypothetical protein